MNWLCSWYFTFMFLHVLNFYLGKKVVNALIRWLRFFSAIFIQPIYENCTKAFLKLEKNTIIRSSGFTSRRVNLSKRILQSKWRNIAYCRWTDHSLGNEKSRKGFFPYKQWILNVQEDAACSFWNPATRNKLFITWITWVKYSFLRKSTSVQSCLSALTNSGAGA